MNLCAEDIAVEASGSDTRGRTSAESDTFESAIARIEQAVVESCGRHEEWPARIAGGIGAAIDFLIANPAAARALAIDSRSARRDDADYLEMIARFAALLGDGAPRSERLPASSDRLGRQRDRRDRQLPRPGRHDRVARRGRSRPGLPRPAALRRLRRGVPLVGDPPAVDPPTAGRCPGIRDVPDKRALHAVNANFPLTNWYASVLIRDARGASRKLASWQPARDRPVHSLCGTIPFDANVMARRSSLLLRVVCFLGPRRQRRAREARVGRAVAAGAGDRGEGAEDDPLHGRRRPAEDDHVGELAGRSAPAAAGSASPSS